MAVVVGGGGGGGAGGRVFGGVDTFVVLVVDVDVVT